MVAAVGLLAEIDRCRCRFSAEERFSVQRMARDNEHLYLQLLARARQLPAAAGSTDRGPSQVVSFDPARKRSRAMAMGRGRRSVGGVSSPGRPVARHRASLGCGCAAATLPSPGSAAAVAFVYVDVDALW
jgi:hypothetical protein